MSHDGLLDAEKSRHGWRWVFTSANGATHLGGTWHKTKKLALADGESWLALRV